MTTNRTVTNVKSNDRIAIWRSISDLAYQEKSPDIIRALALPWTQREYANIIPKRGCLRSLIRTIRQLLQPKPKENKFTNSKAILLSAALDKPYYHRPVQEIAKILANSRSDCVILYGSPLPLQNKSNFPESVNLFKLNIAGQGIRLDSIKNALGAWRFWKRNHPASLTERSSLLSFLEFLKSSLEISAYVSVLKKINCVTLIVGNEQHAPWSHVVVAAKRLGISVHHILHGSLASPMYRPFMADVLWTDFESTRENLIGFGAPPSRIRVAPGVTLGSGSANCTHNHSDTRKHADTRRLLILAQWHGWELYGKEHYRHALEQIADVIADRPEKWEVWIRGHPYDTADMQNQSVDVFRKKLIPVLLVDKAQRLNEQAILCDLVGTASSSGVIEAISCRVPAFMLWNDDLNDSHGGSFLPSNWIAWNNEDLHRIFDRVTSNPHCIDDLCNTMKIEEWKHGPSIVADYVLRELPAPTMETT